jgi:hypothetical protein
LSPGRRLTLRNAAVEVVDQAGAVRRRGGVAVLRAVAAAVRAVAGHPAAEPALRRRPAADPRVGRRRTRRAVADVERRQVPDVRR